MLRRAVLALLATACLPGAGRALDYVETPFVEERVAKGELPRIGERVPKAPVIVDLASRGREVGKPGGEIVSLVSRLPSWLQPGGRQA